MRGHIAPQHVPLDPRIEFQTYKGDELPDEYFHCIHCGESTYDSDGDERWPLSYKHFAEEHEANASRMRRSGISNHEPHLQLRGQFSRRKTSLHICPMCGWWIAVDKAILPAIGSQWWLVTFACSSVLLELDDADLNQPLAEVRKFLRRRYESRYTINPRIYEETVASVFKDIGYRSEVTAYSNDGGIDVVLFGRTGQKIGVQVKRQRRSIEVEQIRAFLGALTLGGYARGMFVSTSKFQRGAIRAAEKSSNHHVPIELVDPDRFFDMLGIAQLNNEPDPDTCGFYQTSEPRFVPHEYLNLNSL